MILDDIFCSLMKAELGLMLISQQLPLMDLYHIKYSWPRPGQGSIQFLIK
jgi:hypothetical protein